MPVVEPVGRPDKVHDLEVVRYRGRPVPASFQRRSAGRGCYQLLFDAFLVRYVVRNCPASDQKSVQLSD